MLRKLVQQNRSFRRFDENQRISMQTLRDIVDFARISPSAANLQNLRFWLIQERVDCEKVFPNLKWANYLKDWNGPDSGERPVAYILVLGPHSCTKFHYIDAGIACQSMLLGATEMGLGGCLIASVDREKVAKQVNLLPNYEIMLVIALGVPAETVVLDDVDEHGNIEYWRDERDRHHVPKRSLNALILN